MFVYLILYGAGMLFASSAHYYMSGGSLILAALYLYFYDYKKSGNPLHLRALFSLFWVGGEGVSCLKLSRLQTEWDLITWASFFVALAAFWTVFELAENKVFTPERRKESKKAEELLIADSFGMYTAILLLTAVSFGAFLLEAAVLGYVPFFLRGVPHAYSYFHISGVHYFTVSCVLVPSMAVILFLKGRGLTGRQKVFTVAAVILSLLIPVLCVSRFQLIFAVILAVLTYMQVSGKKKLRYLFAAAAGLIPLYVVLTIARSHDVAYLNGIFEMKNENTPIFITQPYMYIANNYDNFNCLVTELPRHTLGVKGLFPLWALTGLKFLKPELVAYPIFTTKEELTTVTLFYDAYYDFGVAGVFFLPWFWALLPHGSWSGQPVRGIRSGSFSILRQPCISCFHFLLHGIPIRLPGSILRLRGQRLSMLSLSVKCGCGGEWMGKITVTSGNEMMIWTAENM